MNYKYLVAAALQEELNVFIELLNARAKPKQKALEVELYEVEHEGSTIEILTFCSNKMGMPYNAAKLMEVIKEFNPKYSFFIGICAGIKLKNHPLGTVLIPQRVFSYESGKYEKGQFLPDYVAYDTSSFLRKQSENLKGKVNYSIFTDEDLCSGAAVINDQDKIEEIQKNSARKVTGLDMEAYSIACINQMMFGKNQLLVVKGISDFAINKDEDNNSADEQNDSLIEGRMMAKNNSADFTFRLIKLIEDKGQIDQEELEENDIPLQIIPYANYVENPKITFPLKLNFRITNTSKYTVTLESQKFVFSKDINLDPSGTSEFNKPLFLSENTYKHEYKDTCLLKPGESLFSCWIPIDKTIGEFFLRKAIEECKVGLWNLSCTTIKKTATNKKDYILRF